MKVKTINKTIKAKMEEWLETIPEEIRMNVKNNVIVTGGCIASMLLKEDVKDYDIYLSNEDVLLELAQHYTKDDNDIEVIKDTQDESRVRIIVQSAGARQYEISEIVTDEMPEPRKYQIVYLTENAITLSDQVQIITRFTGSPEQIHENYDFIHATNYWTFEKGLVLNEGALTSLLTKELIYSGSRYPICSIIRTRKFIKKGFSINAGQYLKMCLQVSDLNLRDMAVLQDQLIGVDSAYFEAFIACLKDKIEKEGLEVITMTYLFHLIDYIFDRQEGEEREE